MIGDEVGVEGVKSKGHYSFEQQACLAQGNRFLMERAVSPDTKMTLKMLCFFSISRIGIVDRVTRGFHPLWATPMSDSVLGKQEKRRLENEQFLRSRKTGFRGSPYIISFPFSRRRSKGQKKVRTVSRGFKRTLYYSSSSPDADSELGSSSAGVPSSTPVNGIGSKGAASS
jgi:hypothetical protein